jgi:hypothetical protein
VATVCIGPYYLLFSPLNHSTFFSPIKSQHISPFNINLFPHAKELSAPWYAVLLPSALPTDCRKNTDGRAFSRTRYVGLRRTPYACSEKEIMEAASSSFSKEERECFEPMLRDMIKGARNSFSYKARRINGRYRKCNVLFTYRQIRQLMTPPSLIRECLGPVQTIATHKCYDGGAVVIGVTSLILSTYQLSKSLTLPPICSSPCSMMQVT